MIFGPRGRSSLVKNKHGQNEYVTALQTQYPALTLNLDILIDESRPVLNYTLTSLDYETDEFVNLGIQRNGQSDSDLVQMNKSWKNVRPTGLELAIQYDLDVTDFVGLIRKDSSSHFMYSLALDSMESVPINLVISFDISNSMAGQRKVILFATFRDLKTVS